MGIGRCDHGAGPLHERHKKKKATRFCKHRTWDTIFILNVVCLSLSPAYLGEDTGHSDTELMHMNKEHVLGVGEGKTREGDNAYFYYIF